MMCGPASEGGYRNSLRNGIARSALGVLRIGLANKPNWLSGDESYGCFSNAFQNASPLERPLRVEGAFVRGENHSAHHQPRTPEPGVPCCPDKPPGQQVAHHAGGRGFRALNCDITIGTNLVRSFQAHGCGVGGFSTLFRPALKYRGAGFVRRAQLQVYATEKIRGKTGSAPSGLPAPSRARQAGALLFRPFSWAMQEKGQGNRGRLGVVKIRADV